MTALSHPVLPPLSPAFITADDAARWAHALIGSRRDFEYGGVVLKRGGIYYATHPVPDQRNSFEHALLLAIDSQERFLAPPGYSVEAFYHSHPADAEQTRRMFPMFTEDQVLLFNSFYSVADQLFSIDNRYLAKTHYLSGPDQTLLKYVSSGSALEKTLRRRLSGEEAMPTSSEFEAPIWNLADAGELSVLLAHPVWGGVPGRVRRGWKIRTALTSQPLPQMQPAFTRVVDQAALAVLEGLSGAPAKAFGFVLKHTQSEMYVATRGQPLTAPLFAAAGVFPARADGQPRLPSQFRLEASYYRFSPDVPLLAAHEPWLSANFFTPTHVAEAIAQGRATEAIQEKTRGLGLYLAAADQALLRFQLPTVATPLTRVNTAGLTDDNDAQAHLLAGTLSPRGYVRRVIEAGALSVVRSGDVWHAVGPVNSGHAVLTPFYRAVLSRTFLAAVDAAVYAHERIAGQRDRPYGGYVLKDREGRFCITEPLESRTNPFASLLFYPAKNDGPLIPPEGYAIHGRYGSHPALSRVDYDWVQARRWTREDALVNLQVFSTDEAHAIIQSANPAYLSAAEDCLLAYAPSGSDQEILVSRNTAAAPGGNSMQAHLDQGLLKPAQWVLQLAGAGDFRVIVGNSLWGPRSPVYSDWTPNFEYAQASGPLDVVTYGAIFPSADAAARDLHARVQHRQLATDACFAFILKHQRLEQYVATQVVEVRQKPQLFRRRELFASTGSTYHLPEGFTLCGLFRAQQWHAAGLTAQDAWLTRFFVMPEVMYLTLYEAERLGRQYLAGANLPSYFSTEDGALLKYVLTVPGNFGTGGPWEDGLESTRAALTSGVMTPQAFAAGWTRLGQLSVLRTSQCWDAPGAVSAAWAGYENLARRRLSPAYANPDDAVRHARDLIGEGRQRTYGGVVLQLLNGLYCVTEPLAVPAQGFALEWIYPDASVTKGFFPAGAIVVGRYRSVVAEEWPILFRAQHRALYAEMMPTGVLGNLLHREPHIKREYLIGRDGAVVRYRLNGSAEETALKAELAPLNPVKGDFADNLIESKIRSGELLPAEFVTRVAKAGELYIVDGNDVLGPPRLVVGEFISHVPSVPPESIRSALADPPFGPVFTQADDAVRSITPAPALRGRLSFGYLLKSKKKDHYMVTLPAERQDFEQLQQMFPHGQLPQDYAIEGLYLCAGDTAISHADDSLGRRFFGPWDILKGLYFVRSSKNGGDSYKPLYLRCADDALLKYRCTTDIDTLAPGLNGLSQQLQAGTWRVLDFVRDLASKGTLEILRASPTWAGVGGHVTRNWRPSEEANYIVGTPLLVCGPVCAHADDVAKHNQVARYTGKTYMGAVLKVVESGDLCALTVAEDVNGVTTTLDQLFTGAGNVATLSAHRPDYYQVVAVHTLFKTMEAQDTAEPFERLLRNNFVSPEDLRPCLDILKRKTPAAGSCYITTRSGALLKYQASFSAEETQVLTAGTAQSAVQWVSGLRQSGVLSVLVTDMFWSRRGPLGPQWQTRPTEPEPDFGGFRSGGERDEL